MYGLCVYVRGGGARRFQYPDQVMSLAGRQILA